jgi:hypothetical protein
MKRFYWRAILLPLAALPFVASPALADTVDLDADADTESPAKASAGVMVRPFDGPRAKTIHDRFVQAVSGSSVTLVPAQNTKARLDDDASAYAQVAKEQDVHAFIRGKVEMTKKSWTLTLEVRSSAGEVTGSEKITSGWLPGLLKAIDKEAEAKMASLLQTVPARAPSSAAVDLESGVASKDSASFEATAAKSPDDTGVVDLMAPPPLFIHAGLAGIYRSFTYTDPFLDTKRQELFPHSAPLGAVRLDGAWYPGMHFTDGLPSYFGINVHYIRSVFGSTSVDAEQVPNGAPLEYPTVFQELDVGLRARIPMGTWEIGLNWGIGSQQMGLSGDNATVRLPYSNEDEPYPGVVPDIDSTYYRFGADVGFPWLGGDWNVGAGMRLPNFSSEPGALAHQRWYPDVIGTAGTLSVGVNFPVTDLFGLQLLADYRQTGLDMNSSTRSIVVVSESDPNQNQLTSSIAGGAVDRYIVFSAGITWGLTSSKSPARAGAAKDDEPEDTDDEDTDTDTSTDRDDEADTSNPAFFGETSVGGSASTSSKKAPAKSKQEEDTSNPDFFK